MINNYLRCFLKKGAQIVDYSLLVQKSSDSFLFDLEIGDYLYVGQIVPFNNMFFDMQTVNSNTANIKVETFDGTSWHECVDILDGTDSFKQSGVLQWVIDRETSWQLIDDTSAYSNLGLTDKNIYNLFWARISVDGDLSSNTAIARLRYKFTDEAALGVHDPDLNTIKDSWDSNKTSWLDQILTASELVALDLKGRKIISSQGQIFRFDELYMPTAFRCLSLIYAGLGTEFIEKRDYFKSMYYKTIGGQKLSVDQNKDGHLQRSEISNIKGGVYR